MKPHLRDLTQLGQIITPAWQPRTHRDPFAAHREPPAPFACITEYYSMRAGHIGEPLPMLCPVRTWHNTEETAWAELWNRIETRRAEVIHAGARYRVQGSTHSSLVEWYTARFGEPPRTLKIGELRFPKLTPYRKPRI